MDALAGGRLAPQPLGVGDVMALIGTGLFIVALIVFVITSEKRDR